MPHANPAPHGRSIDQLRPRLLRAIADPGQCPDPDNPKGDRSVSEWSRDAVLATLIADGWVLPGIPPVEQVLADARQFSDELVLTKLVARFFRVLVLGAVIIPETPHAMDWLRDYIDGHHTQHGPLGRPMIWPDRLPMVAQMLREWGFQPTPTIPPYVALKPGGVMAPLNMPDPVAPDPRSVVPLAPDTELRMASILDDLTGGVPAGAVPRGVALRAMAAAFEAGKGEGQ